MATAYRVTSPYVVLKVMDPMSGSPMMNGFYRDAIVTDDRIAEESLRRHLDRGWLEKVAAPAAPETETEPETDPDAVPTGTIDEVLAWVGEDRVRAEQALEAERANQKRTTLVGQLEKLAAPSAQD